MHHLSKLKSKKTKDLGNYAIMIFINITDVHY